MDTTVGSVELIHHLAACCDFLCYYVLDGVKMWNHDDVLIFLAVLEKQVLYFLDSFPYIQVAFSQVLQVHKLCDFSLLLFIGQVNESIQMLKVKLLVLFIIIFYKPKVALLYYPVKVKLREPLLFFTYLFTHIWTILYRLGK